MISMTFREQQLQALTRRHFLRTGSLGLGALALSQLSGEALASFAPSADTPLAVKPPMFGSRAKSVIYLHMSGSPPQHELFEWKPTLQKYHLKPCPEEFLKGQRFAFIKGVPKLLGTPYKFTQRGQSGTWISELLPHLGEVVDDIAVVKSMSTKEFNHAPAELFLHTGENRAGRASIGAWVTYGLGSANQNLPGFIVLVSGGTDPTAGKSVWGSGSLPSVYQGVQCRTGTEPIFYVNNPAGMDRDLRRRSLDALKRLNEYELEKVGDPETLTRISQYELAYRMQVAVPEVMNIANEPKEVLDWYGAKPGASSFANNCLLARRMVENGVRYVQLFDWGWDCHGTGEGDDIVKHLPMKCREVDRPIAALIRDLKERGLLDETLVIWGGEFGRTPMNEARNGSTFLGRDHHPHCFTMWMAGGGIRGGITYGSTDELGYFVTENRVEVHDLQATILHLLGIDPHKFTFRTQGLNQRLIGPEDSPQVVHGLLA
jgi:hypothetical protein